MKKNFKKNAKVLVKRTTKKMKKQPEKTVIIGGATAACAGYGAIKLVTNAFWRVRYALRKSVQPPVPPQPDADTE